MNATDPADLHAEWVHVVLPELPFDGTRCHGVYRRGHCPDSGLLVVPPEVIVPKNCAKTAGRLAAGRGWRALAYQRGFLSRVDDSKPVYMDSRLLVGLERAAFSQAGRGTADPVYAHIDEQLVAIIMPRNAP